MGIWIFKSQLIECHLYMRGVDTFSVGSQGKFIGAVFFMEFLKIISVSVKCCSVFCRDNSGADLSDFCPSLAPSMPRQEKEYCLCCYQLLFSRLGGVTQYFPTFLGAGNWELFIKESWNGLGDYWVEKFPMSALATHCLPPFFFNKHVNYKQYK